MDYLRGRKMAGKSSHSRKSRNGGSKLDIDRYNEDQIFILPNSVYICVVEQTTPTGSDNERGVRYISGTRSGRNSAEDLAPGKIMISVMENTLVTFDTTHVETKTVAQLNQLYPLYIGMLTEKGSEKLHKEFGDSFSD